jgi:hypothetical protein
MILKILFWQFWLCGSIGKSKTLNFSEHFKCKSVQYFLSYIGFKSRPSFSMTLCSGGYTVCPRRNVPDFGRVLLSADHRFALGIIRTTCTHVHVKTLKTRLVAFHTLTGTVSNSTAVTVIRAFYM